MSIKVEEKFKGRTRSTGPNATAEMIYFIRTTDSETEEQAEAALLEYAPTTYAGLSREGISFFEEIKTGDGMVRQLWQGTVRYIQPNLAPRDPGFSEIRFRTTGGTQHIQFSQNTKVRYVPLNQKFLDFKNAIGVRAGGGVEGVDIEVPIFEWQETHVFTAEQMTLDYIFTLYDLTGTVNDRIWRVFKINDCLYRGAEGGPRPDGNWEVIFYFAAAKTREITRIGDIMAINGGPIIKRGFDYLWVYYREEDITLDGSAEKALVPVPRQVNVEETYDQADFRSLGIGS